MHPAKLTAAPIVANIMIFLIFLPYLSLVYIRASLNNIYPALHYAPFDVLFLTAKNLFNVVRCLYQVSSDRVIQYPPFAIEWNLFQTPVHIGYEHCFLIRSGQDWGDTEASERKMYLGDVEPVLREGMDFLRDSGRSIGCYANRYMTVIAPDGTQTEKSYGMSWWKSLAALERWAESHPTHVRIFGAAMKYLSTLGPAAKLRLYHEVTVARADEQLFEYVDCHPQTGMLNAVQTVEAA